MVQEDGLAVALEPHVEAEALVVGDRDQGGAAVGVEAGQQAGGQERRGAREGGPGQPSRPRANTVTAKKAARPGSVAAGRRVVKE